MATDVAGTSAMRIEIVKISLEDPWRWLAQGWRDLWRAPGISLAYGLFFAIVSAVLTGCLFLFDLAYLLLPLVAGFMLVGPLLAVGLYEASRRLESGEPLSLRAVAFVSVRSPTQLAFIGVFLMLFLLIWIRIATLLFALFLTSEFPPVSEWVSVLIFTWNGLGMLIVGTVIGAAIAFAVFAFSAISVPMLMVREIDAITAAIKSIEAVRLNFSAMLLWAWLIALLTAVGIATLFVGLIVTFPLVGHATWHAYRALVADPAR